jgi:hypothetical protein
MKPSKSKNFILLVVLVLVLLVYSYSGLIQSIISRRLIGTQDIYWWDGVTRTFAYTTSDGKVLTFTRFGTMLDALLAYGYGNTYTDTIINNTLIAIGTTNKLEIVLSPGAWTTNANRDWSTYTNVTFTLPHGSQLTCSHNVIFGGYVQAGAGTFNIASGKTLTFNGSFEAGPYSVFSGSGTVAGLKEVYPEWFGATGDGTVDDSTAIAAAVSSVSANGTLKFVPSRTYYFAGVHISNDITIDLNSAILKSTRHTGGVSEKMLYSEAADAVGRIEIKNGKIDGNGSTRGSSVKSQNSLIDIVGAGTVIIKDIEQYGHAAGISGIPDDINTRTLAAIRIKDCSRVIVDKIIMHDNYNEQLWICSDTANTRVSITNSQWYNGQTGPANTPISIFNCASALVEGNTIIDSNCSAMNILSANSIIRGNYIDHVNHSNGIDLAEGLIYANDSIVENNIIKNCDGAGILAMGSRIKILNNIICGCYQGIHLSAAILAKSRIYGAWCVTSYENHENIQIHGNTIMDTKHMSSITGIAIMVRHTNSGNIFKGIDIINNYIYQPNAVGGRPNTLKTGIYLDSVECIDIIGNKIYDFTNYAIRGAGDPVSYLTAKRNRISSRAWGDQDHIVMSFTGSALQHDYIENDFEEVPTSGRYNINFSTVTMDTVRLVNNEGLRKYNVKATNLYYRKDNYANVTCAPTFGTYLNGDIVRKVPSASSIEGYAMVNRDGTLGTLSTTGSIAAGSYILTVASSRGISTGVWISIAGAGPAGANLGTMVTAVSGTKITIWNAAGTSVTGAAVGYSGPDVKSLGVVGP